MALKQHITELYIKNYRQFRRLHLNFCDPTTDQPLEKICFIGPNGTGKTTLLGLLSQIYQPDFVLKNANWADSATLICWQVQLADERYFVLKPPTATSLTNGHLTLPSIVESSEEWHTLWNTDVPFNGGINSLFKHFSRIGAEFKDLFATKIALQSNSDDLAIYSLPNGVQIRTKVPKTTLSEALGINNNLPAFHLSNSENLAGFWNFLIYQIKKRESDYQTFLSDEKVQALSVAEARKRFEANHPEILVNLAKQWNLILEQAGLEFDIQNAKIPYQLTENLEAYIRVKDTNTVVDYNLLSAGVLNFIFRLGHIYTLYFNRHIERGFLFLDEPEQSLYPDLLYDIIERYLAIIQNTQLFVATHSEIIAAQFKPSERIRLQFKDDGSVTWRRGVAPEGDDPNDVLRKDFSVRSLYGKAGIKQWQRYLELRREIKATTDPETKTRLIDEYLKIGEDYNFAPHEIPT